MFKNILKKIILFLKIYVVFSVAVGLLSWIIRLLFDQAWEAGFLVYDGGLLWPIFSSLPLIIILIGIFYTAHKLYFEETTTWKSSFGLRGLKLSLLIIGVYSYVVASSFTLQQAYDYYFLKAPLSALTTTHSQILKEEIFTNLFSQAELCRQFDKSLAKSDAEAQVLIEQERLCFIEIGSQLAKIRDKHHLESEISKNIFFVKVSETTTSVLGWDGKLREILHQPDIPKSSSFFSYLRQEYLPFKDLWPAMNQVFTSFEISDTERGYVAKIASFKEEDDLIFWAFLVIFFTPAIPLLFLLGFINSFVYDIGMYFPPTEPIDMVIWLLVVVFLPLLPLIVAYYFIKRRKNDKKN